MSAIALPSEETTSSLSKLDDQLTDTPLLRQPPSKDETGTGAFIDLSGVSLGAVLLLGAIRPF